jgi:hypothetical protein
MRRKRMNMTASTSMSTSMSTQRKRHTRRRRKRNMTEAHETHETHEAEVHRDVTRRNDNERHVSEHAPSATATCSGGRAPAQPRYSIGCSGPPCRIVFRATPLLSSSASSSSAFRGGAMPPLQALRLCPARSRTHARPLVLPHPYFQWRPSLLGNASCPGAPPLHQAISDRHPMRLPRAPYPHHRRPRSEFSVASKAHQSGVVWRSQLMTP